MNTGASWARVPYLVFAWLSVIGVLGQGLLAGLSLLAGQRLWEAHIGLGHFIGFPMLLTLILAFVGRFPRPYRTQAGLLFGIYFLQAEVFAGIRDIAPLAAAFHPVLAFVVFWLAVSVAQQAWSLVRMPRPSMASPQRAEGSIGD